jgi:hypothetical protein
LTSLANQPRDCVVSAVLSNANRKDTSSTVPSQARMLEQQLRRMHDGSI